MLAALVFDLVDNSKGLFGGPLLLTPLAELPGPQLKITERTNRYSADLSILWSWSSAERALSCVCSHIGCNNILDYGMEVVCPAPLTLLIFQQT